MIPTPAATVPGRRHARPLPLRVARLGLDFVLFWSVMLLVPVLALLRMMHRLFAGDARPRAAR